MRTQISILGCGWLGLPLAKLLIAEGYTVKGSTTSDTKLKGLTEAAILPYIIKLSENGIDGNIKSFLEESETIIINVPPGLRKQPSKNHISEIEHIVKAIENSSITNVLFISSTSVFKDESYVPLINAETSPNATSNSAQQLIAIENMLKDNAHFNTSILRFGGLIDQERHPGKYLSGRQDILNPEAPVNLIHKRDCIGIILNLIKQEHRNIVLNAAYPSHWSKKDYYTNYCIANELALPEFNNSEISVGKIIDSNTLVQLLGYSFQHAI